MNFNGKQISEDELSEIVDDHLRVRNSLKEIQTDDLYGLGLNVFTKFCYTTFSPNEAGYKMVKYFANRFKFHEIPASLCKGDFFLNYKKPHGVKYIEMKCSLLNKNGYFGIRNIRPWHEIDLYLLCFIPSPSSLPYFFLVKLEDLKRRFTTTYMNGTAQENKENKKSGVGMTIPNNTESLQYLSSINVLGGQSIDDFIRYFEDNTYLPFGFNQVKNDSSIKTIIEKPLETPTVEVQKPKTNFNYSNLGGFRVGHKFYVTDSFSKNYVEFISRVLNSNFFQNQRDGVCRLLGKNLVQNLSDFPSSTLGRPSTIHKVTSEFYLTTNNNSLQKKENILKICNFLSLSCDFYSNDEIKVEMTLMAA